MGLQSHFSCSQLKGQHHIPADHIFGLFHQIVYAAGALKTGVLIQ